METSTPTSNPVETPVETKPEVTPTEAKTETPVTPSEPAKETPKWEDRHTVEKEYSKEQILSGKVPYKREHFPYPSSDYNRMAEYQMTLGSLPQGFINSEYRGEEKPNLYANYYSQSGSYMGNSYVEKMNNDKDNYVNNVVYSDKSLNTRKLSFTDTPKDNLSQAAAVARFRSLISAGDLIQVPLWHSGFWVTLTPPSLIELTNLEYALHSTEIRVGRETSTMVYSNYGVITHNLLSEFIVDHIQDHSLRLGDDDDIRDHILLPDFNILVNGLCSAIYPEGYAVIKACKNSLDIGTDNKPKCNFRLEAVIDPKKLLFVDRAALSNKMLAHMSNRQPNSVSLDDVKEYQLGIKQLMDQEVNIKVANGTEFKMVLSVPTLMKYITTGEKWVNNIIKASEDLFTKNDTNEIKTQKTNDIIATCALGSDNSFVKSINDNITDDTAILEVLNMLNSDEEAYVMILMEIRKYINNAAIAIIATPAFTCPTCKEKHDGLEGSRFSDFIPLNVVEHFFGLSGLKKTRTHQHV